MARKTSKSASKPAARSASKPVSKPALESPAGSAVRPAAKPASGKVPASGAATAKVAGAKQPLVFEALPARYGDCLLLTVPGPRQQPARLLIDGGPSGVYLTTLKPRLDRLAQETKEKPLTIDTIMVSHIDEDHILGILDLFGAVRDADERQAPRPYQPRWLLHNSFDGLVGEGEGGTARSLGGETVLASLDADVAEALRMKSHTARLVLQSYSQGSRLASMAAALNVSRNPPDQGLIQFVTDKPRVLRLGEATLTVVGPLQDEIKKLQDEWAKWKAKQKAKKKDTAALAAYLDNSVPNLSSIVALMECNGSTILLTGDARGDRILEGLTAARLMPAPGPLKVDILKLPHHGSARNLEVEFFEKIHADHYVASADGTYGNPDRETLEMIEKARPDGGFTMHLTYSAESCDKTHEEWLKGRKDGPFDPKKHAIADIVARWKAGGKIKVEEGPVRLEL